MSSQHKIGAIYPITEQQFQRIFNEGKSVFVKFTNMTDFKVNSKIAFYIKKEKTLHGEGTVKSIQRMSPSKAWSKYGKELILTKQEYELYTLWSPISKKFKANSELTVFVLKNLIKYQNRTIIKKMTPSGRYLTEEEYNDLSKM